MGHWWEWSKYTLPSGKTLHDVKSLVPPTFRMALHRHCSVTRILKELAGTLRGLHNDYF
jgi:hypothetical protein